MAPSIDTGKLDAISTFPALVRYLRDALEWPIETENFNDLTFDYAPRELGLRDEDVVRGIEIKQLRPLTADQPWGIFFLNFPKKSLPVTLLRRVLGALTIRKRKSANKADRAAWENHDLLFISAHGETGHR